MLRQVIEEQSQCISVCVNLTDPANLHLVKCSALWDTGASCCAISPQVVRDLDLPCVGERVVTGIGTSGKVSRSYLLSLELEDGTKFTVVASEEPNIPQHCCIIGLDIIRQGNSTLLYDGDDFVLTFEVTRQAKGIRIN